MKNLLNKAFLLLLTFLILITANSGLITASAAAISTFKDVKTTAWYCSYISRLAELKITSGYSDGTYKPNCSVTRAEFLTFLCKAAGHQPAKGGSFIDTDKHWASGYIAIALSNGIVDIPADKRFKPGVAITRLEAVEMLCRALNIAKDTTTNPYKDVSAAASGYTGAAYTNYLMQGSQEKNGRYFKPSGKLTRAEAAAIIVNAYEYHADKMAYLNNKVGAEKEKAAKEKAEQDRYTAWKESVKDIPPELMSNIHGLVKPSVYESYKYLRDVEKDYLKNWGAKYGMTPEQFEMEMVRVGSLYATTWANANYNKISTFENNLKTLWETSILTNHLKSNIDKVKNNTVVSEGTFTTSTGMLIFAEWGNPVLRGTMRSRYLRPTSTKILNSDFIGSSRQHLQLGVWYEQDFEITFLPEPDGLKTTGMDAISDIRISK
jgi:hypothetical protein